MIARRLLYRGSGPMTISALFAVSAWMVRPPGELRAPEPDAPVNGIAADWRAASLRPGGCCPGTACMPAAARRAASDRRRLRRRLRRCRCRRTCSARSVCATRAASAFFRYTMNMLPPGRPGVSSCSISAFTRAARAELSERSITLLLRGSATMRDALLRLARLPRGGGRAASAPSSRLTSGTRSSAEAYFSVTIIGSPHGGWSSDATIFSMRRRFSA